MPSFFQGISSRLFFFRMSWWTSFVILMKAEPYAKSVNTKNKRYVEIVVPQFKTRSILEYHSICVHVLILVAENITNQITKATPASKEPILQYSMKMTENHPNCPSK